MLSFVGVSFRMNRRFRAVLFLLVLAWPISARADDMPWVVISKDKKGFALEPSKRPFVPWGFNYDHDTEGRLISQESGVRRQESVRCPLTPDS